MLKSGGVFARFANHPFKDKGREEIHTAVQRIYARYMPGSFIENEYDEKSARKLAQVREKYRFIDTVFKLYHRTRSFAAREYVSLLGTYSDHIAIEDRTRKRFFHEIGTTIEDLGDEITIYDTLDLELYRKP